MKHSLHVDTSSTAVETPNRRRWLGRSGAAALGVMGAAASVSWVAWLDGDWPPSLRETPVVAASVVHFPAPFAPPVDFGVAPSDSIGAPATALDEILTGEAAKRACLKMLDQGDQVLAGVVDFRAKFVKQERLDGELLEAEELDLKMRLEPMCVYMRWIDPSPGREVIWHRDAHEGRLLIHESGWRGKLAPMLKLSLDNPLVASQTRRPISEVGLWELANQLRARRWQLEHPGVDLKLVRCELPDGRPGRCCTITHADYHDSLEFHKINVYLDETLKVAVGCECFGWPEEAGAEPPLEELYVFHAVELNVNLSPHEFDPNNDSYQFVKRESNVVK